MIYKTLNKSNWNKGHAKDDQGRAVLSRSEQAVARDLRGWIEYEYPSRSEQLIAQVTKFLRTLNFDGIAQWNDHPSTTLDEVIMVAKHFEI